MLTNKDLVSLLEIAGRAIEAQVCTHKRQTSQEVLRVAYRAWKHEAGVDQIERESDAWHEMMRATVEEYQLSQLAKRQEYNAKRRLSTAICKYGKLGEAA